MQQLGEISEWNEGTFKSMRLHETQDILNSLRLNPLTFSNGKFNYEKMFIIINSLYHEGISKFSTKEIAEVDVYMNVIKKIIKEEPPTTKEQKDEIGGTNTVIYIDNVKLNKLLDFLQEFERKVKYYNDQHGLTTMNRRGGSLL